MWDGAWNPGKYFLWSAGCPWLSSVLLLTPESISSSWPPTPPSVLPPLPYHFHASPQLLLLKQRPRKNRCTSPLLPVAIPGQAQRVTETDVLLIGPEHCLDKADLPKWTLAAISPKLTTDDSWHVHPLPQRGRAEDRSCELASRPEPSLQPLV